jgi:membrane protein CcdC involved in cytochrome C biogenesis
MAKVEKSKQMKKTKQDEIFPLERENYIILGIGLLVIIIGYIALSGNKVEGFSQLTLAPILLVLGYCVIIPIGIMYRKKEKPKTPEVSTPPKPIP